MYLHREPDSRLAAWHGFGEPRPQTQQQANPQSQPQQRAKQIYAASGIRELTDRHFQNIFYDRDKLIVVSFWADSCRPCDAVASTVVSVAQRIAQGPHARLVKFYHAQWDPAVNPRLYKQYGFSKIPVVYFYYMCSGKQPTREVPLLEGATRGDRFDTDPAAHLHNIETILRRHGHIVPARTVAQTRGWSRSQDLIGSGDFRHVDQMLREPSRVSRYIDEIYCANPKLRLSQLGKVVDRSTFNLAYQRINGGPPDAGTLGVVDPNSNAVYLLAMNIHLHAYLNSAVHEAVHLCTCRRNGRFVFYLQYGAALNEGFTQRVTEDILTAQNVTMSSRPYDLERQIAEKLISKLGFTTVADDYFRCTRNVYNALNAARLFSPFFTLRTAADRASSEAERKNKYREIIHLLDGLPNR
jgi:thiol-disulfide isomerase/thioredoxin